MFNESGGHQSAIERKERVLMKARIGFAMLISTLLVLTASVFAQDVRVDYDHHANFNQYHTYSWAKVQTANSIWDERVKEAVDQALAAKGWSEVPAGGDVSIVAMGITRERPTLETFYNGFGGWRWGGFGDATTWVETYREGTLVVDMFDTQTKKLIWRASASETLSDKPEKNVAHLHKAVQKMFEHFPPKPKEA